jgi:nucleotide-binding universal stress UspA family protein
MFTRILIPTDGSRLSGKAIRQGVRLARVMGGGVTGLIATPTYRMFTLDPVMSRDSAAAHEKHRSLFARRALAAIEKEAAAAGISCRVKHVVSDQPHRAILNAARRSRSDLIVMASHGRGGAAGLLLGSVAHKVLTHASLPVLICR